MAAFRAHFDGKVIIPDEPADLPRNQPLMVDARPAPQPEEAEQESFLDWAIRNPIDDPSLPTDLAHQHDHYLYGTPKRED